MGIPGEGVAFLRRLSLGLLVVASSLVGCETKRNDREVSAEEFITPAATELRVLSSKRDLLKSIRPTRLDSLLAEDLAKGIPLREIDSQTLLIYESINDALVSIGLCPTCADNRFLKSPVKLHWNQSGLEEDLFDTWNVPTLDPEISFDTPGDPTSPGVTPIALRGADYQGWILAFETTTGSLVAFKQDPLFRPAPTNVLPDDLILHPNFGKGNGLIMAVVISGTDLANQVVGPGAGRGGTRISRIIELENGKILLLFTTVRQVHLLELRLEPKPIAFDLERPDELQEIMVPKGSIKTFPVSAPDDDSFVSFKYIQDFVTQNADIKLDTFQPVYLPANSDEFCSSSTLPGSGSALVYDFGSKGFLRITEIQDESHPRAGRGRVELVLSTSEIQSAISANTGEEGPPEFFMSEGAYEIGCSEALIFEEISNNLLRYDYGPEPERKLNVAAGSSDFLLRRRQEVISGEDVVPSNAETVLRVSESNILENRLYFDQGQQQLLSVYLAGENNVVIVAERSDFEAITASNTGVSLTYMKIYPTDDENTEDIRAFDEKSSSMLLIFSNYILLPVVDRQR